MLDDPIRHDQLTTRYAYDEHHNRIGIITLRSNMIISNMACRYDGRNNLIEAITYGVQGNVVANRKHVYEYDAEGNWTRQIIMMNNKPVSVILHKIEYY